MVAYPAKHRARPFRRPPWSALVGMTALAIAACGDQGSSHNGPIAVHRQPVVGGQVAQPCEYPSTVGLVDQYDDLMCTGTLVADTIVVTAAHCLFDMWTGEVMSASDLSVVIGYAEPTEAPSSARRAVSKVIPHKFYDPEPQTSDPDGMAESNDIGLLVLKEPVTGFQPTGIVAESQLATLAAGADLEIVGFGTYQFTGDPYDPGPSGILHKGVVHFIRKNTWELMAGNANGTDTCAGDSGGPIFLRVGNEYRLLGATSRAASSVNLACGEEGIYTVVSTYASWITEQTGISPYEGGSTSVCDPGDSGTDAQSDTGTGGSAGSSGGGGIGGDGGDSGAGSGGDAGSGEDSGTGGTAGTGGVAGAAGTAEPDATAGTAGAQDDAGSEANVIQPEASASDGRSTDAAIEAPTAAAPAADAAEGGCGCRQAKAGSAWSAWSLVAALAVACRRFRRRTNEV